MRPPQSQLRVFFDSAIFQERHFGGVMRYVRELADGLSTELAAEWGSLGSLQVMAGFHVSPLDATDFPAGTHFGVRMPAIRGATHLYQYWNNGRLSKALARRPAVPTILHETLYGAKVDASPHVRRIVTVHDMIWEDDPAAAPPLGLRLKASSIAAADGVIFVSQATAQAFARHYPPPRQWAVIHHGCELRTTRARRKPDLPWPFILYVGQRQGYKNWATVVRAIAQARLCGDFGLVMFGPPPTRQEMAFLARFADNGVRVAWLQGDDDILADLYASAECLVYPSRAEGFGMPLLEAARWGCPVACSDIDPFREIMGPHAAYFDPDDEAVVAATIEKVIAGGRSAAQPSAAAQRSRDFSWPVTCRKTLDFYCKVRQAA